MHQERENTERNILVFLLWVGHRRATLKGTREALPQFVVPRVCFAKVH